MNVFFLVRAEDVFEGVHAIASKTYKDFACKL